MPAERGPEGRDPVRRTERLSYTSILKQRLQNGWTPVPSPGRIAHWARPDGSIVRLRRMEPDSAAVVVTRPTNDPPTSTETRPTTAVGTASLDAEQVLDLLEDVEDQDPEDLEHDVERTD